jgi:DNA-binding CsgD family transcriptional regulator
VWKTREPNLDPTDVAAGPVAAELKAQLMEQVVPAPFDRLTEQELRVAKAYALGCKRGPLAEAMHLSVRTVDTHRGEAYRKLGVETEAELARLAIRVGLTSIDNPELRAALEGLPESIVMPPGIAAAYQAVINAAWRIIGGPNRCMTPPPRVAILSRVHTEDVTAHVLALEPEDHTRPPWKELP